ncbi:Glu/Leu/Phe/Val dehydrogenase [Immundisolibacter sp.]|uniref:Glu/Leu/Phe/Val family dehydrogenase n=1 Tax=Immundisolibacter sp. TaxID=1934948 RepID=UPI003562EC1C
MHPDLPFADDLGPARVIHVHQPALGLAATVVLDNLACGPAIGGLRMASDVTTAECARLARAMTLKNAAAGLPHGGGKSVLRADPRMPVADKERLIRAFAAALRHEHGYIVGPDMGTDETCMAWIHDEIGRATGLPRALGGIPLDQIGATGWGVCHATEVALARLGRPLTGARLAVQGFGSVGQHAARFLTARGARLVAVADSAGAIHNPDGIDPDRLLAIKAHGGSVVTYPGAQIIDAEALIGVDCEVWIPAARPDVIHAGNVDRLRAALLVQGANIPATADAERSLHARGVWVVPDFIANAGGVICAAFELQGATEGAALAAVEERIRANTATVLDRAQATGNTPRQAAETLALERVRGAMQTRRWGVY